MRKFRLEYNEKQNAFHLDNGTHKEGSHGWQTIATDVDDDVATKFIAFANAMNFIAFAKAKEQISGSTIEEIRTDFLAFNKSFNPDDVSFQDLIDEFKNDLDLVAAGVHENIKPLVEKTNKASIKALEKISPLEYEQQVAAVFTLARFCNDFVEDFLKHDAMEDIMNHIKNN